MKGWMDGSLIHWMCRYNDALFISNISYVQSWIIQRWINHRSKMNNDQARKATLTGANKVQKPGNYWTFGPEISISNSPFWWVIFFSLHFWIPPTSFLELDAEFTSFSLESFKFFQDAVFGFQTLCDSESIF